jgi:hypothetical protein
MESPRKTDGNDMKTRFKGLIEGVVTAAIILVLLQTLAEDILVISGAAWSIRKLFIYTGFAFDLFFTFEFLIRSWNALAAGTFRRYITLENGWVDFVASVPLLILASGPAFFSIMSGAVFAGSGALIGLLKVVKAVRMARVLRLLRLLKIFRRIRFADSSMVQRHTVRIITTAASTLIFSVTIIGTVFAMTDYTGTEDAWQTELTGAVLSLEESPESAAGPDSAGKWGESRPSVILLKDTDWTLYSKYDDKSLTTYFGPGDYIVREAGSYNIWFDIRPSAVTQSKLNLTVFLSTLAVVLLIMITYSPHFAITVSDPVNVMIRGITEKSYNLEVSVPSDYSDDDIFRMATAFNDEFLPLKERNNLDDPGGALDISMDDISDLLGQ